MTDTEFFDWSADYCDLFQLKPEWVGDSMKKFRELFETDSYSYAEINAALQALVRRKPGDRNQHINAIMCLLREARTQGGDMAPIQADDPRGTCTMCGSSGYVTVPHPKCISRKTGDYVPYRGGTGMGSYYELAVFCRCALGKWKENQHQNRGDDQRRNPTNIDQYERFNPVWDYQMKVRAAEDAKAARLQESLRGSPHWLDAVMNRIRDRVAAAEKADRDEAAA